MLIINKNHSCYTINGLNRDKWIKDTGKIPEDIKYILDNGELADKILSCAPYFEPIEDGDGNLIDIIMKEPPLHVPTVEEQIAELQKGLLDGDYKIIKNMEVLLPILAELADAPLPYDPAALHTERQEMRDRVNALQEKTL